MPIKTAKLDFTEDGYPDFHAKARLNIPMRIGDELQSGDEERARAAALLIFPSWDFVDEDGKDIPHTVEGVGMMPQELFEAMMARWADSIGKRAAIDPKADGSSPPISPNGAEVNVEVASPNATPA
jgi:hypothetical protein